MIQEILAAMVGTIAFSLLFGVPRKYYLYCGLIGGAGWGVYSAAGLLWAPAQSALAATIVVILLSRLAAVRERCPVTIFLISGIFPLVPGAGVYWTVYYMVTDQLYLAVQTGYTAVKVAVSIVLGIVFVFELPQGMFRALVGRKG
ncbi:MAG: threonine/serine exporter family protein [Enterocloster asparagiformis]|nr:threonine/serine exporter family protein [Enterocloster asparagiformis]